MLFFGADIVHLFCGFWSTIAVGLFCDVSGKYSPEYLYQYPWIIQTSYQFLGWLIIVTIAFLLSSFVWLLTGNFLFWREQIDTPKKSYSYSKLMDLPTTLKNFVTIGCKGIRVSSDLEKIGSDDFFE